jgi:ABC-type ATPase with predicted acetyltransferase domain
MSIFDRASKKVTNTVNLMQKKTNDTIAVKKLESQIKSVQGEIDIVFLEIGKRVYAARANGAQAELNDLFETIDALNAKITGIKDEINRVNAIHRCASCGEEIEDGIRFCPRCGASIAEPAVKEADTCPACGAARNPGARFCDMCGHDYSSDAPAQEEAAPAEAPEKSE